MQANERSSEPAAIIGVVVAGVLASFVVPGPYSWDTTMLGAILLLILVGYTEVPARRRQAAAVAAAAAFGLVYLLGHFVDDLLDLSGWPEWDEGRADGGGFTNVRESLDRPHENSGWETFALWAALGAIVYGYLRLRAAGWTALLRKPRSS